MWLTKSFHSKSLLLHIIAHTTPLTALMIPSLKNILSSCYPVLGKSPTKAFFGVKWSEISLLLNVVFHSSLKRSRRWGAWPKPWRRAFLNSALRSVLHEDRPASTQVPPKTRCASFPSLVFSFSRSRSSHSASGSLLHLFFLQKHSLSEGFVLQKQFKQTAVWWKCHFKMLFFLQTLIKLLFNVLKWRAQTRPKANLASQPVKLLLINICFCKPKAFFVRHLDPLWFSLLAWLLQKTLYFKNFHF